MNIIPLTLTVNTLSSDVSSPSTKKYIYNDGIW